MPRAEDVLDEPLQRPLRSHLDEHPGALAVQRLEPLDELDGRGDLPAENVEHRRRVGVRRVQLAGDVGDDRHPRAAHVEPGQCDLEGLRGRRDDRGVEGVADRDAHRGDTRVDERLDDAIDGFGRPADDGLVEAVDVGDDDVAVGLGDDPLDLRQRAEHGCHRAVVGHRHLGHLATAGADGFEGRAERDRPGGDERTVLTEAVAHDEIGFDAVRREQPGERQVGGEDGRLGDLGLHELGAEPVERRRVGVVTEDERRQRTAEKGRHDLVGLAEGVGDDRLAADEVVEHVDVLRALAGVEEGHLGCGPAPDEDPLLTEHREDGRVSGVERGDELAQLAGQVGGVGEVDGDPNLRAGESRVGRDGCRCGSGPCGGEGGPDLGEDVGIRGPAEDQGPAQRSLGRCGRDRRRRRRRRGRTGGDLGGGEHPVRRLVAAGNVLLHDDVEVRPAEAEGTDRADARARGRLRPGTQGGVDGEGAGVPVDVRVGVAEVQARGEDLLVERADHLVEAGGSRRGLEVADVGLHRAEGHRPGSDASGAEHLLEAGQLGSVPDPGRGAVRLDRHDRRQVRAGVLPRPVDGELLADRVGRGDPLALAVG